MKKRSEYKVFQFAGMTVIPDKRINETEQPALSVLVGAGVGRKGGYFVRKNVMNKYEVVSQEGAIIEDGLSKSKSKEYELKNDNRQYQEIMDLFDNVLINVTGVGGRLPYNQAKIFCEDRITERFTEMKREYFGMDVAYSVSEVIEEASCEMEEMQEAEGWM